MTLLYFINLRRLPSATLFPYTTLFRSLRVSEQSMRGEAKVYLCKFGSAPGQCSQRALLPALAGRGPELDRKSTRLNSSHANISYAVFCLKKKKIKESTS